MKNSKIKNYAKKIFMRRAVKVVENPKEALAIVANAKDKLDQENIKLALGGRFKNLKLFLRMMKAYALGEYKDISKKHIVLCVLAVIYFLNPADLVPDIIAGLGFIDDLAVINWVYLKLQDETIKFKDWESKIGEKNL